jgi:hypothetical protein
MVKYLSRLVLKQLAEYHIYSPALDTKKPR